MSPTVPVTDYSLFELVKSIPWQAEMIRRAELSLGISPAQSASEQTHSPATGELPAAESESPKTNKSL